MSKEQYDFHSLKALLVYLRDPDFGCPWDVAQTMQTIVPYTIEEVFEVIEALESGDWAALKEELGDLLLQVIYYAQMADEAGYFDLDGVVHQLVEKMVRRHPHVFQNGKLEKPTAKSAVQETKQIKQAWEKIKQREVGEKAKQVTDTQITLPLAAAFARVPKDLCVMNRAQKLQARAAKFGLDWLNAEAVRQCLTQELEELDAELAVADPSKARVADELGDVLLTCISLARHLELDASQCLRQSARKFTARAEQVERLWVSSTNGAINDMAQATPSALHEMWVEAKKMLAH